RTKEQVKLLISALVEKELLKIENEVDVDVIGGDDEFRASRRLIRLDQLLAVVPVCVMGVVERTLRREWLGVGRRCISARGGPAAVSWRAIQTSGAESPAPP